MRQPLSKGDVFGMKDAVVYCRLHLELLYDGTPAAVSAAPLVNGGGGGGGGGDMTPCDLSCGSGPQHGLLPPSSFGLAESMSPGHMMITLTGAGGGGADGGGPGADAYHHSMRASSAMAQHAAFSAAAAAAAAVHHHHHHHQSLMGVGMATDFQRCLNPSVNFFPNLASVAVGGTQKGRPRKRKMVASSGAGAANEATAQGMRQLTNSLGNFYYFITLIIINIFFFYFHTL